MLNKYLLTGFLATATAITTVIVDIYPSYGQAGILIRQAPKIFIRENGERAVQKGFEQGGRIGVQGIRRSRGSRVNNFRKPNSISIDSDNVPPNVILRECRDGVELSRRYDYRGYLPRGYGKTCRDIYNKIKTQ